MNKWGFVLFHSGLATLMLFMMMSNMIDGDYFYAVADGVLAVCNIGLFTLFLGDK